MGDEPRFRCDGFRGSGVMGANGASEETDGMVPPVRLAPPQRRAREARGQGRALSFEGKISQAGQERQMSREVWYGTSVPISLEWGPE